MKFEELNFKKVEEKCMCGIEFIQARVDFENGYGASVVRGYGTYGVEAGLYELAVVHNGELCYDSGLTDDVVGWLMPDEITEWLEKIEKLPSRSIASAKMN